MKRTTRHAQFWLLMTTYRPTPQNPPCLALLLIFRCKKIRKTRGQAHIRHPKTSHPPTPEVHRAPMFFSFLQLKSKSEKSTLEERQNQLSSIIEDLKQNISKIESEREDIRKEKDFLNYLKDKVRINNSNTLKNTHQEIAYELHSSRVVISRLLKKLENIGKIKLHRNYVEIINLD